MTSWLRHLARFSWPLDLRRWQPVSHRMPPGVMRAAADPFCRRNVEALWPSDIASRQHVGPVPSISACGFWVVPHVADRRAALRSAKVPVSPSFLLPASISLSAGCVGEGGHCHPRSFLPSPAACLSWPTGFARLPWNPLFFFPLFALRHFAPPGKIRALF
jgi:hypothetical protein